MTGRSRSHAARGGELVVDRERAGGHPLRGREPRAEPLRRRGAARRSLCSTPRRSSRSQSSPHPASGEPRRIQPERPSGSRRPARTAKRSCGSSTAAACARSIAAAEQAYDVGFDHISRLLVVASSDGAARVWATPSGDREAVLSLHAQPGAAGALRRHPGLGAHGEPRRHRPDVEGGGQCAAGGLRGARRAGRGRHLPPGRPDRDGRQRRDRAHLGDEAAAAPAPVAPGRPRPSRRATRARRSTARSCGSTAASSSSGIAMRSLSVEFSPDGRRVVTASADGDARIWNAAHRPHASAVLSGHGGTVFDASFSPDGTWVVTGGPATAASGSQRRASVGTSSAATSSPVRAAEFASPTADRHASAATASAPTSATSAAASARSSRWRRRSSRGTGRELTQRERLTYLGEP